MIFRKDKLAKGPSAVGAKVTALDKTETVDCDGGHS